jgi:hypothetical protein
MNVSQFLLQQLIVGENNGQLSKLLSHVAASTQEVIGFGEGLWVVLLLFPVIAWAYFSLVPLNLGKFVKSLRRLKVKERHSINSKNDSEVRKNQSLKTNLILEVNCFSDAIDRFHEVPFP